MFTKQLICSKRFSHWRTLGSIPEFVNQMNQKRTLASISERPEMKSRNLDTDEVYLDLIDEVSPGVVRINTPFLYVLMPMRVSQ